MMRYVKFVRDQKLLLDKAREQLNDQSHVRDMEAAKGSSESSRYHGYVFRELCNGNTLND